MVARGLVQNGVIVLQAGIHLPEGLEVTVLTQPQAPAQTHGILDIPTVNLGAVLQPFTSNDDSLGEMLEGRS